jgi:hypothetical protein
MAAATGGVSEVDGNRKKGEEKKSPWICLRSLRSFAAAASVIEHEFG